MTTRHRSSSTVRSIKRAPNILLIMTDGAK
jgi:hypothetical protein